MKRRSGFKARRTPNAANPGSANPRPAAGHPFDVFVEKLIYGGDGLARHEGATVFVPFVLPSERVTVEPVERKKDFVRARLVRVVDASPERADPRCPHFGACGGCDYQHIPYEAQLRYKVEILRETLRRTGKIDWTGEITTHASDPWKYRNRAQWKIRPAKTATSIAPREAARGSAMEIGYFRARSTSLCAVHDCPILSPVLLKVLLAFRDALATGSLPPELREVEAFTNEGENVAEPGVLLTLTFSGFPSGAKEYAEQIQGLMPEVQSLLFHDPRQGRMALYGPGFLRYPLAAHNHRVGHFSFFQVNRFLAEELARAVCENDAGGELALDLFAGVGLFALPLAEKFQKVIAVESNPAAARDLEINAAGAKRLEIRTADAEDFLQKHRAVADLVVVDPPRAGLAPQVVRRLTEIGPHRITYVSCEPPTLGRDLRILLDGAYRISSIDLFDLFPQSFHMETVVRLLRS
ncbi:MAG TPA: 23S rRNA (uracil(1939)-C(5))-methyltransferase RlmD [Candidatus Acidoferrales bacterium]|nr:23S rRNA (uracil(1939)-C(5))-methyltransferase RlmD [Candidatus Acidoferrales bacterium]